MSRNKTFFLCLSLFCLLSSISYSQGADIPTALAIGVDNHIYVTGTSMSASGRMEIITLAYDPNGRLQGSKRIPTTTDGAGIPAGIIVQGNNITITATHPDATTGYDIVTASYTRSSLVSVNSEKDIPNEFTLEQSYPNPVSSSGQEAIITFTLPSHSQVKLSVVDNLGKEVAVLVDEMKEQGKYQTQFNPSSLPSGTYYYVLQSSSSSKVKKVMVVR